MQEGGSLIGLSLILYSVFAYSKETPFPSVYAFAPTLGTVLIILCTTPLTLVGRLLITKVFVGVGLVSYSAYLWHQPLFAFYRYANAEVDGVSIYIVLSGISFLLAYLTWRFIETPFRKKRFRKQTIFTAAVCSAGLFIFIGIYGAQDGLKSRFDQSLHNVLDRELQTDYVIKNYNIHTQEKKDWNNNGNPKVLLVGDSYSQDLFNAISEIGLINSVDLIARYVPVRCGVLFVDKQTILETATAADLGLCSSEVALIEDHWLVDKIHSADHIWLASSWREKHLDLMSQSIVKLRSHTQGKIVVFGGKTLPKLEKNHLAYSSEERSLLIADLSGKLNVQNKMRNIMKKEYFVDVQSLICESKQTSYTDCKLFDRQGMPKSYDGGHLTKYGAVFYGQLIEGYLKCSLFRDCGISD